MNVDEPSGDSPFASCPQEDKRDQKPLTRKGGNDNSTCDFQQSILRESSSDEDQQSNNKVVMIPSPNAKGRERFKRRKPAKFKKAPQAPKRFKSAYMHFSTKKHKEIRAELKRRGVAAKTTAIAKEVSRAWKELSSEEREQYKEIARRDKERFAVEKSLYKGPWKVPANKRYNNDPTAPKRPKSAFLSYSHDKREEIKRAHPGLSTIQITQILAQRWRVASEEEKREHIEKEQHLRKQYMEQIAQWRKVSEHQRSEERRQREAFALRAVDCGITSKDAPLLAAAVSHEAANTSQNASNATNQSLGQNDDDDDDDDDSITTMMTAALANEQDLEQAKAVSTGAHSMCPSFASSEEFSKSHDSSLSSFSVASVSISSEVVHDPFTGSSGSNLSIEEQAFQEFLKPKEWQSDATHGHDDFDLEPIAIPVSHQQRVPGAYIQSRSDLELQQFGLTGSDDNDWEPNRVFPDEDDDDHSNFVER